MTDFPVSPTQADLVDYPMVVVIFDVIVNADVGVTNLTIAQLRDIYAGLDTNWHQVGRPNLLIWPVEMETYNGFIGELANAGI